MFKSSAVAAALFASLPAVAQSTPAPVSTAPQVAAPAVDPAALAEARLVVGHLLPPGVYKKIMGPMMGSIMDNAGEAMRAMPLRKIAEMGGLDAKAAAELDKVRLDEVMSICDPYWQKRMQLSTRAMFDAMGDYFTTLEPEMREAMAHAYANHFSLAELTDIEHFFETSSGAKFAAEYMTVASDPAMLAEMQSMMPKMMAQMPTFIAAAQKATADLPPPRKMKDLTPADRARLAKALGVDERTLRDPKTTT